MRGDRIIIEVFLPMVVGTLKPSTIFGSLPSLQLVPSLLPSLKLNPSSLSSLQLPAACRLSPQRWWGPQHILNCSFAIVSKLGVRGLRWNEGSKLEQAGVSWERAGLKGVRGASFSLLPCCPLAPCPPEAVGTPIHTKLFIGIWE